MISAHSIANDREHRGGEHDEDAAPTAADQLDVVARDTQREQEHTDRRRADPERDAEDPERSPHAPPDAAFGAFLVLTFGGA